MKKVLYDWGGLNVWLFELINGIGGDGYDWLMLALSELGEHRNFKYYFGLIFVYLLAETVYRKVKGIEVTRRDVRSAMALLILLVMGYVLYGLIIGIVKSIVPLPRPFMVPEIRAAMHFIGSYPEQGDYRATFPSDHAATMAFIVTVLWHRLKYPALQYAGIALVALVGWARIAAGMNFPADVVAGALVGIFVGVQVRRYVYRMMGVEYRPATAEGQTAKPALTAGLKARLAESRLWPRK